MNFPSSLFGMYPGLHAGSGPFGMDMNKMMNVPGFILEQLPAPEKAKKYVELLLPEVGDEDRVLMGEPGLTNNSYMGFLYDFTSNNLEWFAAFIGLNNIAEKGKSELDIVVKEMLAHPKSIATVVRYMYKTPFIGPQAEIPSRGQRPEKPQTHSAYYKAMAAGVVSLFSKLCGNKEAIPIVCKDKYFQSCVYKLTHFLNPATSTAVLTELSLNILHKLSTDPRTLSALTCVSNSVPLLTSQTKSSKISATHQKYAQDLVDALSTYTPVSSSSSTSTSTSSEAKHCAVCNASAVALQKCGRCKGVYYCGKEHQLADWPTHKQSCKKPDA